MKQDDPKINKLEKLMSKYKFTDPTTLEDQAYMLSAKKPLYKRILKTVAPLSIFTIISINIYFLAKKFGINVILTKIIISLTAFLSLTVGTYITVKYLIPKTEEPVKNKIIGKREDLSPSTSNVRLKIEKEPSKLPLNYWMEIKPVKSDSIDNKTLNDISQTIVSEISYLKGKKYPIFLNRNKRENFKYKYTMLVSVDMVGNNFVITIKIIRVDTTSIYYIDRESAGLITDLDSSSKKIIKRIISKIE